MYTDRWSPGLRQGDVLGPLLFPLVKARFEGQVDVTSLAPSSTAVPQRLIVPAAPRHVAIVSHDCEFNEGKRDHFLVARIRNLPARMTPEQMEELKRANDVEARSEDEAPVAVDTFVLEPLAGAFEREQMVDFCSITPFPMGMRTDALTLKKAELEHGHRVLFRKKLAVFVGRDAEDIADEEKHPAPDGHAVDAGD